MSARPLTYPTVVLTDEQRALLALAAKAIEGGLCDDLLDAWAKTQAETAEDLALAREIERRLSDVVGSGLAFAAFAEGGYWSDAAANGIFIALLRRRGSRGR